MVQSQCGIAMQLFDHGPTATMGTVLICSIDYEISFTKYTYGLCSKKLQEDVQSFYLEKGWVVVCRNLRNPRLQKITLDLDLELYASSGQTSCLSVISYPRFLEMPCELPATIDGWIAVAVI
ncbi:hypothetical protein QQP08_025546, partial [Theobroma cacao]